MKTIEKQINDYLRYCEAVRRMTGETIKSKRNVLRRFVGFSGLSDLRRLDNAAFNRWVEGLSESGVSARSINTYNAVVLAMVRYYRGVGLSIPLNLALVPRLKTGKCSRKFYTAGEVSSVVAFSRRRGDEAAALMIEIMFETGMRIAEISRLRVEDFDGRRIRFVGKGRKPREVYIRRDTLVLLERYVRKWGITGYLWCVRFGEKTLNGEPPTINTIRAHLQEVFLAAGFPGFYPHALRHSFATDLQVRGASITEIKEMIGHENIATTERYLHGFEGRLLELFDKYR